jgi:hypothetical protein
MCGWVVPERLDCRGHREAGGIICRVIAAGLGYLFGGIVVVAVWLAWLLKGKVLSAQFVDDLQRRARAARAPVKWIYGVWRSPRLDDPADRERFVFWMWLPLTLFAPVLALALFASAVGKFRR